MSLYQNTQTSSFAHLEWIHLRKQRDKFSETKVLFLGLTLRFCPINNVIWGIISCRIFQKSSFVLSVPLRLALGFHLILSKLWLPTNLLADIANILGRIQGTPLSMSTLWGWWHRFPRCICMMENVSNPLKWDLFWRETSIKLAESQFSMNFQGQTLQKDNCFVLEASLMASLHASGVC